MLRFSIFDFRFSILGCSVSTPLPLSLSALFVLLLLLPLNRAGAQTTAGTASASPGSRFDAATGTIIDSRWKSGVPLGGIGVGKVELLTDGSFGNFTCNHNWDRPYGWAKGAFAAVWAQERGEQPAAKLLRLPGPDEYKNILNVQSAYTQGWFPRAHIRFADSDLPVQARLDAFAPLIPHDPKDSALPVACLVYTLSNLTRQPVRASVLLAWPNLLGWGGRVNVAWNDLTGDQQSPLQRGALIGLRYTTTQDYTDQRQNVVGEYFLGMRAESGMQITACPSWDAGDDTPSFWDDFAHSGRLRAETDANGEPKQPAGAVAAQITLAPGRSRVLRFYFAWYMPHHITIHRRLVPGSEQDRSQQGVAALFDHNPNTRWTTNRPMLPGDNLVVDLGREQTLSRLTLESAAAPTDYPRGYRIEVSTDDHNWRTAAQADAGQVAAAVRSGNLDIELAPIRGRFLRITNLEADSYYWWSIFELKVYAQGRQAPLDLPPNAAAAYLVHSEPRDFAEDVGHYYLNWFHSADQIAAYADDNYANLLRETYAWQEPVLASNLPFWLKLKLINCAFPLFTNTILTQDGRFVVQESPVDMNGATGTMDQRMAAHAFYTAFFPELDRDELEIFAACQQPDGRITHFDGNIHEVIGRPDVNYGITDWPDLSCSWVMQVAKLYRWTGDRAFLDRMWPHVQAAMAWLEAADHDGDFIPEGGSTYDYEQPPPGAFIYTASCYLGALRAADALAAAEDDRSLATHYQQRLARVQQSVMANLWNGTFFRKWNSPAAHQTNEDSFVANLAGDWLARLTGLPRTLPRQIVHQSIAQTIARHQKPFFPVPPMEVTPDGKLATTSCYLLQHEPYLGCEAIYENFVDDGLETLRRVYLCAWELNHSPWDESLGYDVPVGTQGGLICYMTAPTTWHVLDALGGASVNLADGTLYLSPRLSTSQTELHIPIFFSRFWAWLDYVPARRRLTLRIDRVYPTDPLVMDTLFTTPDQGTGNPKSKIQNPKSMMVIRRIVGDVDSPPIPLPRPFVVRPRAVLNLSPQLAKLALPARSEVVDFMVQAAVQRPGLPAVRWKINDNVHESPDVANVFGQLALDGDPHTRWTTGRPMRPGDRLTLDMGRAHRVGEIVLDSAGSPHDYPRGYSVEVSKDGKTWREVAHAAADEVEKTQQNGVLTISFAPISIRYLRITNLGAAPNQYWSIHELAVFPPP